MIAQPPLDAPDEEWLVWADAMQQAGDPRGELIALAGHPEQLAKHVTRHADRLFGPTIGRHVRKGRMRVTWRRAVPDIVEIRVDDKSDQPLLLAEVVESPIAHAMRGIAITAVTPNNRDLDAGAIMDYLTSIEVPRNWTSLSLIDDRASTVDHMITRDFAPEPNLVTFGPLDRLWPQLPHLEELRLVVADPAQHQLGTIRLPELRSFALHCLYWTDGTGRQLAASEWPKLSSLEIRLVEDFTNNEPSDARAYRTVYSYPSAGADDPFQSTARNYVDRAADLQPLFENLSQRSLERLAVTSFNNGDLVLTLLEDYPLYVLTHLDLSDSALTVEDLERLANNPLVLQLDQLVIERITAAKAKMFGALDVRHSHAPNAPSYRYVVGWE